MLALEEAMVFEEKKKKGGLDAELNEILTIEKGWLDVSQGLLRILLGLGVLVGGTGFGTGLVVMSVFLKGPQMFWAFFAGLGLLGCASLFSYGILLAGQLKCLIYTPERHGARWFIFACMVCLAMGPLVNMASYFGFTTQRADFRNGVQGLNRVQFNTTGRYIQAASAFAGIGYNICFILYLRSIGCCFRSRFLIHFVEAYFVYEVALVGACIYLLFFKLQWMINHPAIFLAIGGGFVLQFIWYLTLLFSARLCIGYKLGQVRTAMGHKVFAD